LIDSKLKLWLFRVKACRRRVLPPPLSRSPSTLLLNKNTIFKELSDFNRDIREKIPLFLIKKERY